MKELKNIIHHATGKMQKTISNGTEIFEFIEEKIIIMPIGLVPLDNTEGYFF